MLTTFGIVTNINILCEHFQCTALLYLLWDYDDVGCSVLYTSLALNTMYCAKSSVNCTQSRWTMCSWLMICTRTKQRTSLRGTSSEMNTYNLITGIKKKASGVYTVKGSYIYLPQGVTSDTSTTWCHSALFSFQHFTGLQWISLLFVFDCFVINLLKYSLMFSLPLSPQLRGTFPHQQVQPQQRPTHPVHPFPPHLQPAPPWFPPYSEVSQPQRSAATRALHWAPLPPPRPCWPAWAAPLITLQQPCLKSPGHSSTSSSWLSSSWSWCCCWALLEACTHTESTRTASSMPLSGP